MNKVNMYICEVAEIAGLPLDHPDVEEIQAHVIDLAAEKERDGLDSEEATDQALAEFGSALVLGRRLREVSPLLLSKRDLFLVIIAGVLGVLTSLVQFPHPWGTISWLAIVVLASSLAARPFYGALAPVAGLYLAHSLKPSVIQVLAQNKVLLYVTVGSQPFLGSGLRLLAISVFVGFAFSLKKGRVKPSLSVNQAYAVAGLANLFPFLILFGLSGGVIGVLAVAFVWYLARNRSVFVARHALQTAVVAGFAVVSQLLLYLINLSANRAVVGAFSTLHLVALTILAARFAVGVLTLHSALSAFIGHDFRYPFAQWLFGTAGRQLRSESQQ